MQQQVASQLLADLDAAEIKVQLDVDSLTQVNAQNVIIEAAIKVYALFHLQFTSMIKIVPVALRINTDTKACIFNCLLATCLFCTFCTHIFSRRLSIKN